MGAAMLPGAGFRTFEQADRVLVALSGGVDSSVCVQILRDQGFDVSALVIRFSPAHDAVVETACAAAQQLGVPLTVADCADLFEREVGGAVLPQLLRGRNAQPLHHMQPAGEIPRAVR